MFRLKILQGTFLKWLFFLGLNISFEIIVHLLCNIDPLNAELNPICHLLALLGGATIVVLSRLRFKENSYLSVTVLKFFQFFY